MRLEGAHDSRAVNRRARGAETRRPRASGGLCRAWGSLFARPASKPHGPRDCPRGRSRFVATRTDSWAYGYGALLTFAQPDTKIAKTRGATTKLPA